jgi:hypothetical protein
MLQLAAPPPLLRRKFSNLEKVLTRNLRNIVPTNRGTVRLTSKTKTILRKETETRRDTTRLFQRDKLLARRDCEDETRVTSVKPLTRRDKTKPAETDPLMERESRGDKTRREPTRRAETAETLP